MSDAEKKEQFPWLTKHLKDGVANSNEVLLHLTICAKDDRALFRILLQRVVDAYTARLKNCMQKIADAKTDRETAAWIHSQNAVEDVLMRLQQMQRYPDKCVCTACFELSF
jgi:hypothetical protein